MSLSKTYQEGYAVEIRDGQIWGVPPRGSPFFLRLSNPKWQSIAIEVASLISEECLVYSHHSTKPRPERKDDQLTLVFDHLGTFETAVVFFNVDVGYQRDSKNHQKGERRPQGQFTPAKLSSLVKLFRFLGLQLPQRLSLFHQALPQLRGRIFTATKRAGEGISTIDKASLRLLNLSTDELKALFNQNTQHATYSKATHHPQGNNSERRQALSANPYATPPAVNIEYKQHKVQATSSHRQTKAKAPQEQTVDGWVANYKHAPTAGK